MAVSSNTEEDEKMCDAMNDSFKPKNGLDNWKRNKPTDILEVCMFHHAMFCLRRSKIVP